MMRDFLMGAITMGYGLAGLFFLRFWNQSRDRLFLLFALAFALLAGNRVVLAVLHEPQELTVGPYLVRLLAFLIILVAIADKNFYRR